MYLSVLNWEPFVGTSSSLEYGKYGKYSILEYDILQS